MLLPVIILADFRMCVQSDAVFYCLCNNIQFGSVLCNTCVDVGGVLKVICNSAEVGQDGIFSVKILTEGCDKGILDSFLSQMGSAAFAGFGAAAFGFPILKLTIALPYDSAVSVYDFICR